MAYPPTAGSCGRYWFARLALHPGAATWRELVKASADPGAADDLQNALQKADLIVVSKHQVGVNRGDDRVVRLVHDGLKDWDVLAEWIKQDKDQIETPAGSRVRPSNGPVGPQKEGLPSELAYFEALDGSRVLRVRESARVSRPGLMDASRRRQRLGFAC
jgi:hypothetical protein